MISLLSLPPSHPSLYFSDLTWGLFVAGACVSIFSVFLSYDVQVFKAHWHLFSVIDVDTGLLKLMFLSQLIYLEGVHSYANVKKQESWGTGRKGS